MFNGNPPRLVLRQHLGLSSFGVVVTGVEVGKRLPIGVADDLAARHWIGVPRGREASGCHRGGGEP
jgi:hypothetical protein